MSDSWIKIQLKNGNTTSIPLSQYLTMTDIEYENLMNSNYGTYINDINPSSNEFSKFDDIDFDLEDE